ARQIPIAPADRRAPIPNPAVSFTGGFRTPAQRPWRVSQAQRAGRQSETRHTSRQRGISSAGSATAPRRAELVSAAIYFWNRNQSSTLAILDIQFTAMNSGNEL